jgi:hypothetical protein
MHLDPLDQKIWQSWPVTWLAYVDESMRSRPGGSDVYVLAAAMLHDGDTEGVRMGVAALARGRQLRMHWRDALPSERAKAVVTVGGLDALHLVVVGMGLDRARQERGRRQCMQRLLSELGEVGVCSATLSW